MSRTRTALAAALALAAAALAPVAPASAAPPRIVGSPALTYRIASTAGTGRFVSVGALVRLDRRFVNTTERHRYSVVAAPRLVPGEILPDELFGGSALGRFARPGAWYQAEAVQLHQRRAVPNGARWQVALARGGRIVGAVRIVTLRRG